MSGSYGTLIKVTLYNLLRKQNFGRVNVHSSRLDSGYPNLLDMYNTM